jgi:hypothetical protein
VGGWRSPTIPPRPSTQEQADRRLDHRHRLSRRSWRFDANPPPAAADVIHFCEPRLGVSLTKHLIAARIGLALVSHCARRLIKAIAGGLPPSKIRVV